VLEDHEGAVEQLRLAVEADPSHSMALCRLGDYYQRLGQHEEAVEAYKRAIKVGGRGGLAAIDGLYRRCARWARVVGSWSVGIVSCRRWIRNWRGGFLTGRLVVTPSECSSVVVAWW
jgi:tetratricopeptide (TPR) repeat protein